VDEGWICGKKPGQTENQGVNSDKSNKGCKKPLP